jgi:hypothetical protein
VHKFSSNSSIWIIALDDFDGYNQTDMISVDALLREFKIFNNEGNETFTAGIFLRAVRITPDFIATGELNNDDSVDMIILNTFRDLLTVLSER